MRIVFIFFCMALIAGCKKFLNVNEDPNNPTISRADYVFTNAANRTAGLISFDGSSTLGATWSGIWAHSTSFTGGGQEKTYQFTNSDFNFFDEMYDVLADDQWVIDNGAAQGFDHLIGPAKILEAYTFQKLVDLYGDIPYSEALKGTGFINPKYDEAMMIYEELIKKIDTAISDINGAAWPLSEPGDIVFGGNKENWLRFGNTLKMRILMRQSFMPGRDTYIKDEINKILGDPAGFIIDNVGVQPGYANQPGKLNLFYGTFGYDQNKAATDQFRYRKMNDVIISWLKNSDDLFRLTRLATPIADVSTLSSNPMSSNPADFEGVPMGSPSGYLEATVSSIGQEQIFAGDATRPVIIFSLAESYFLLAEAAERYGIAGLGTAQTNYEAGVKAAFRLAAATHTITASATEAEADAAADIYLMSGQNFVDWSTSSDKIRTILIQKWVSLVNIDGFEAWSDYRKSNSSTSLGSLPYSPHSVAVPAGSPEPVRLFYPLREESVNGSQVPQGIDVFTSRIFWDVQ